MWAFCTDTMVRILVTVCLFSGLGICLYGCTVTNAIQTKVGLNHCLFVDNKNNGCLERFLENAPRVMPPIKGYEHLYYDVKIRPAPGPLYKSKIKKPKYWLSFCAKYDDYRDPYGDLIGKIVIGEKTVNVYVAEEVPDAVLKKIINISNLSPATERTKSYLDNMVEYLRILVLDNQLGVKDDISFVSDPLGQCY